LALFFLIRRQHFCVYHNDFISEEYFQNYFDRMLLVKDFVTEVGAVLGALLVVFSHSPV
jgi:hypothetical protein